MKKLLILILITICTVASAATHVSKDQPLTQADQKQMVMQKMNLQPLAFTENQGQWDERVLFRANAGGATMWFTADGVFYQFTRQADKSTNEIGYAPNLSSVIPAVTSDRGIHNNEDKQFESIMIKASFVGANLDPKMLGLEEMEYKCNYFISNDPNDWHADVPNYEYVLYEDIYPGIDLKYYGNDKKMEYDFIVAPGVDPSQIKIKYEGAKSLSVNEVGELEVETEWNTVTEQAPFIYQEITEGKQKVVGKYQLLGNNTFGFEMVEGYDESKPLIIDPTLEYSTYLGGSDYDWGRGIAVDSSGCAYITGVTYSTDFPTVDPYQIDQSLRDVFVTKLSSTGNNLIYSTYLGGNSFEVGYDIALDTSGCAYITGYTYSANFPVVNSYQTHQGESDAFVTKLSSAGNSLIYSTYLGGGEYDYGQGIAMDVSGSAYVTGYTFSPDFPTVNSYQTYQDAWDVFVTKLSIAGNSLIYSTYLGGSEYDDGHGIAVDASGCAYITGVTYSSDFPIEGQYQTDQDDYDAFVTKLSDTGNSLIYSTYLGGSEYDYGSSIALDVSGFAYVTGYTYSTDFPAVNSYQTYQGESDIFVSKFSSAGNSLIYSTYLGGSDYDYGNSIALDASGSAYVTGNTYSPDFPIENSYQTYQGDWDAIVSKLSSTGSSLIYSTYLGGNTYDDGHGIALDASGSAYVAGATQSADFPTFNAYQNNYQGGTYDAFVIKFYDEPPYLCGDADGSGAVDISDAVYLIAYIFGGGPAPDPIEAGDADCSGAVDISDAVYLIAYIFGGGPAPCDPNDDTIPDC